MGRTEDLDIQTESIVPPVVKRGGGEHGEPTPKRDESSKRPIEAPNANGRILRGVILSISRCENQIGAGKSGENGAKVNTQVRGSPESIPADGSVPGNVPIEATGRGSNSDGGTPDIPRNRCDASQNRALRTG